MARTADCGLRWPGVLAVVLLGSMLRSAGLQAQRIHRELGIEAYTLRATPDRVGGALYAAWRVSSRARVSLLGGMDGGEAGTVGRAEALVHFLLAPDRTRGVGIYGAGGLAADIVGRTEARLVALVGVEQAPGARQGWMMEAGVGGGWRFAAGWRWRR